MADCNKLTAGILFDCDNIIKPGAEDQIVIFNWVDVDKAATNLVAGKNTQIETLATLNSATGFIFSGTNSSNVGNEANVVEGFNQQKYEHTPSFYIFQDNEEVPERVKELVGGNYIVVLFTKNQQVKVYGWDTGLRASYTKSTVENEALYPITFANNENEYQTTPAKTYISDGTKDFETLKGEVLALAV